MTTTENLEIFALWKILKRDVTLNLPASNKDEKSESDTRSFVRAVFAMIEGVAYAIRQTCLTAPHLLTPEEIIVVKGISVDLKEKGVINTRPISQRLISKIRFTFNLWIRINNLETEMEYDGMGWRAFLDSVEVRNRITHPKSVQDLHVSLADYVNCGLAFQWFEFVMQQMLSEKYESEFRSNGASDEDIEFRKKFIRFEYEVAMENTKLLSKRESPDFPQRLQKVRALQEQLGQMKSRLKTSIEIRTNKISPPPA